MEFWNHCDANACFCRYNSTTLNAIKIFCEFQIFSVLLICCVLQTYGNDFSREYVTIDDWGFILTAVTLAVIPVAITMVYINGRNTLEQVRDKNEDETQARSNDSVAMMNPLDDDEDEGAD